MRANRQAPAKGQVRPQAGSYKARIGCVGQASVKVFFHKHCGALYSVFCGHIIGQGTDVLGAEVEAAADAGVDQQFHRTIVGLQRLYSRFNASPALVLLFFPNTDQRGNSGYLAGCAEPGSLTR